MQALIFEALHAPLRYGEYPDPQPQAGEVLVEIRAAALNHRDVWITRGQYPGIRMPAILGSDGAGLLGQREVLINPGAGWGANPLFPARDYRILGMPEDGVFAPLLAVSPDRLADKPAHLNWAEAAALPLAGLTAYRAVFTKGQVQAGQRVLVTGIGGGVALMAAQFALSAGAEVWASSGSAEKINKAVAIGLSGGVNYKEANWAEQLAAEARGFDLIIDSAGGEAFASLLKLAQPGGRIVVYGGALGNAKFSPQALFWRQLTLLGTSMGTDEEFAQMIQWVGQHKIVPIVDSIFSLTAGNEAFQRMDQGLQFGKIVLEI